MITDSFEDYLGSSINKESHIFYRDLILNFTDITHFELCRYHSPPPLQKRITINEAEQDLIDKALEIRKDGVTPFWPALFSTCLKEGWVSENVVTAALFHNGPGQIETKSTALLKSNLLTKIIEKDERNVGLSSRLKHKNGSSYHLALLDFRSEVTPQNTKLIKTVCTKLFKGGFVLIDSGDSYHACGLDLLSEEERLDFLAKSLMLAPIIDTAYIGHQLQQPFSSIRISKGGGRNKVPRIVAATIS